MDDTLTVDGVEEVGREEIVAEIDREAKGRLGMTFEEFRAAYEGAACRTRWPSTSS